MEFLPMTLYTHSLFPLIFKTGLCILAGRQFYINVDAVSRINAALIKMDVLYFYILSSSIYHIG